MADRPHPTKIEPAQGTHDPREAVRYWDRVLDPQNLEAQADGPPKMSLEDEIDFAQTPDFLAAEAWLREGAGQAASTKDVRWVMDLGAGLGAHSLALARRGWRVVAVDTSPARLAALRARAHRAGVAERIWLVVASAEALPWGEGSVPALLTKSVLIHVDQRRAAAELARVLQPGGRAALIEPQPANPFAWLYRKCLAPPAWQGITRYFDRPLQRLFIEQIERKGGHGDVKHFYLFGFLAFVWQFGWPWKRGLRACLALFGPVDRALFKLFPLLRRAAWFGIIRLER